MIAIALGIILAVFLLSTIEYWIPFAWVLIKTLLGAVAMFAAFAFLWVFLGIMAGV